MAVKRITYESWRVKEPRNLDIGEHWSKESQVHTAVSSIEAGTGVEFRFRDIRTLRKIVRTTTMYLESDAHPDSEEKNKRYVQRVDEINLAYIVRRVR